MAEATWTAPGVSTSEEHWLRYLHPDSRSAQRKLLGCRGSRLSANSPSSSLGNKLTHQMLLWHSFHLNSTNPAFPSSVIPWITKFPAYLQRGSHSLSSVERFYYRSKSTKLICTEQTKQSRPVAFLTFELFPRKRNGTSRGSQKELGTAAKSSKI